MGSIIVQNSQLATADIQVPNLNGILGWNYSPFLLGAGNAGLIAGYGQGISVSYGMYGGEAVNKIWFYCAAIASSPTNTHIAVYQNGILIAQSGNVVGSFAAGAQTSINLPFQVAPGLIAVAINGTDATAGVQIANSSLVSNATLACIGPSYSTSSPTPIAPCSTALSTSASFPANLNTAGLTWAASVPFWFGWS